MAEIFIIKRDGSKEAYSADKIHEKTLWACEGLSGVSASDIEMNASLHITDGIKAENIQKALISSASELISTEAPNYEYVTARLLNQQFRKEVYGKYEPNNFYEEVVKRCEAGIYDKSILEVYTKEEIEFFGSKLDFNRDDNFTFTGLQQLYSKYAIRVKDKAVETPQEIFMLMNMYVFAKYEAKVRDKWVLEGYNALSNFEVSLPTPQMNGLRTDFKRFISCNLIEAGDTTNSLAMANAFIMMMTANKSGLGLGVGDIRGIDADIGGGRATHTGILPILKSYEKATKAFTQVQRGGSSTNFYPFFHYEAELIMQLGNAKGTDDKRVRHADHAIVFNELFIERWLTGGNITLFHMNEVEGLHDAIGDNKLFKKLYEGYEKTVAPNHKKVISAEEYAKLFFKERFLQGRLYYLFADNVKEQGLWKMPIKQSNLCLEVLLPTKPLDQPDAEVACCILAGINHGNVTNKRIPIVSEYLVRFLEEMIDYMEYSHDEIERPAKKRRTLGIGHSDIFHYLAKNKVFYNTVEGRDLLHRRLEHATYYMTRTSMELAKEKGACEQFGDTYYSEGQFTIDRYNKNVDELISTELECDWEGLREMVRKYGMRHSTLTANAPFGNSAKPSNSTSGAEPPRFLATPKSDKKVKVIQLAPEYNKYKNYYTTAWGVDFNNTDYFKMLAVMQKFIDQSISANQYTNLLQYENNKVPMEVLMQEFLVSKRYGLKTMYYQNFRTSDEVDGIEAEETIGCESGGCEV